jgi:hypothetical protein
MTTPNEALLDVACPHMVCPHCPARMRISAVTPFQTVRSVEKIIYRCDACRIDLKQIIKPLEH